MIGWAYTEILLPPNKWTQLAVETCKISELAKAEAKLSSHGRLGRALVAFRRSVLQEQFLV